MMQEIRTQLRTITLYYIVGNPVRGAMVWLNRATEKNGLIGGFSANHILLRCPLGIQNTSFTTAVTNLLDISE